MTLSPKDELTRQWLQVATDDLGLAELANRADRATPLLWSLFLLFKFSADFFHRRPHYQSRLS
jgi:hypothetical protein